MMQISSNVGENVQFNFGYCLKGGVFVVEFKWSNFFCFVHTWSWDHNDPSHKNTTTLPNVESHT